MCRLLHQELHQELSMCRLLVADEDVLGFCGEGFDNLDNIVTNLDKVLLVNYES
jgi:hypothetical protein